MITLAFGSGSGHFHHISVIEFTISWDPIVSYKYTIDRCIKKRKFLKPMYSFGKW